MRWDLYIYNKQLFFGIKSNHHLTHYHLNAFCHLAATLHKLRLPSEIKSFHTQFRKTMLYWWWMFIKFPLSAVRYCCWNPARVDRIRCVFRHGRCGISIHRRHWFDEPSVLYERIATVHTASHSAARMWRDALCIVNYAQHYGNNCRMPTFLKRNNEKKLCFYGVCWLLHILAD